jgi:hypothetical protein
MVLLAEHDLEVAKRRMVRPQLAGERVLLRRDREQEQVVDRQQRPDRDGNADQKQLRLGDDFLHRERRFIMK